MGVIALVPEAWDLQWQRRHQVLSRLARRCRVAWLNPAHGRQQVLERRRARIAPWRTDPDCGLEVYTPEWYLPIMYRGALGRALRRERLRRARVHLERLGCRRIALSIWRPEFVGALDDVPHDVLIYHVNDEYSFRADAPPVSDAERRLLATANTTIFCSRALMERKGPLAREARFIPNGVDFDTLSAAHPVPHDLASLPRPIIGYTGWVKEQLDWELITGLARRHPDWSFVLVGPLRVQPQIAELVAAARALPNIHFLGLKPVHEYVTYPGHFDACVMPYLVNGYTRYIYPLKLHEYLATGRPVLSSPIDAVREFGEVVRLADGLDDWSLALTEALGPAASDPARREARQAVARAHDWSVIAGRVGDAFFEALA